ncbi:ABC transporter substrate-binding protein [Patulibacter sp. NPDC049589]|uniref:ABC transporter substrate-binding protein n=1 Tax=Patulibacter sp. NPDC049589 TaxID=3154731 RepID=UPI0034187974
MGDGDAGVSDGAGAPARRLRRLAGAAVPLALVVAFAGCGSSDSGGGTSNAAQATPSKPTQGGTIEYGHLQEPPCLINTWVQTGYLSRQFLDGLVSVDAKGKFYPWLADSWKISPDGKTYTFKLKQGVKFTDGTPFDADAVKTNFKAWLDRDAWTYNSYVDFHVGKVIDSVEATDPATVTIKLKEPHDLLSVLSQYAFGILSPKTLKGTQANGCERPVGTGGFTVEKWNHGKDVVLKRNPNYASAPGNAKHQGPAYVDGIDWKFLKDDTQRYGSLTSGESDAIYEVPGANWSAAKKQYEILQHITGGVPVRLALETKNGPFTDVRVRQAFGYASDRRKAVETIFRGAAPYNGNGALSAGSPEHLESLEHAYDYDPNKAAALLDQAGWTQKNQDGIRVKDGKPLQIKIVYSPGNNVTNDDVQVLQIIQDQAKQVGFDVVLKPVTQAGLFSGQDHAAGQWDAEPWYWVARTAEILHVIWAPQKVLGVPNGNNVGQFDDPETWKLISTADKTTDVAARTKLYQQAQERIVAKDALVLGLRPLTVTLAVNTKKLRDVWLSPAIGEPVFSDAYLVKK